MENKTINTNNKIQNNKNHNNKTEMFVTCDKLHNIIITQK